MSYIIAKPLLTKEHLDALVVQPADLRALTPDQRLGLLLRSAELRAKQQDAFWSAVQGVAAGVIPILIFLGFARSR